MPATDTVARRTAWAAATAGLSLVPTSTRHRVIAGVTDPMGLAGTVLWEDAASECPEPAPTWLAPQPDRRAG